MIPSFVSFRRSNGPDAILRKVARGREETAPPASFPPRAGNRRRTPHPRYRGSNGSIRFVGISGSNRSEEPVLFPVRTCREEQGVRGTVVLRPVAKLEGPQSVDRNRCLLRVPQHTPEREVAVGPLLISVDSTVAKVAHEQISPEAPEVFGCHRETPRCIQGPVTCDARQQMTCGVVRIDEPEAVAMELVPRWPLLGVRDEDTAADRLDPKRRIARGDFLIDEPSFRGHGRPSAVER